ncbi:MAG: NF038132 family protein [Kiritimatiellae bacterium]|nr:NF038132 family protein [Kiritimatiellia bacterium]
MSRKSLALAICAWFCCGNMIARGISIIGWVGEGTYGVSGSNGVVTASPFSSQYGWVSTASGIPDMGLTGIGGSGGPTTGSRIRTPVFPGDTGQELTFYFNYVTSDGSGYSDYAWARLLDTNLNEVALLFTARTTVGGDTVPGFSMPAPVATLVPASTPIVSDGPVWSPLAESSGTCFGNGCGHTGWIQARYALPAGGRFILEIGVVNWNDSDYQSGIAFDGVLLDGQDIQEPTPVTLTAVTAQRVDGGVRVSWETAMEFENLGFHVYRSTAPDGERTRVNAELIAGTGTSDGAKYSIVDTTAPESGTVFYWLEDVSTSFETETHEQVAVFDELDAEGEEKSPALAEFALGPESGICRIGYGALQAAGVPIDTTDPATLQVLINGEETAMFVSAWRGAMKDGDYLLFYAPDGADDRTGEIRTDPAALRMEEVYAGPGDEGEDVWYGVADENGGLSFETSPEVARYLLIGFADMPACVLDVTEALHPKMLYGYAWLLHEGSEGLYLSYFTETPAKIVAAGGAAIREIESLVQP